MLACGMMLLFVGSVVVGIPFCVSAQVWQAETVNTNIVAVVDCSTSMQSSDNDWKIRNRWICW